MIFRTAVRRTSHKLGPKGLHPEEMFEMMSMKSIHLIGQLWRVILFHRNSLQWPFNENNPQFTLKCVNHNKCLNHISVPSGAYQ